MSSPGDLPALQKALEQANTKEEFKKVLCVWLRFALLLNPKQIAMVVGKTPGAVRKTQSRFVKSGVQAFFAKQKGGRRRENISLVREKQILSKFQRRAQRGAALDVSEIRKAYELSVGKSVGKATIYRLIARHGLRRYLPRARSHQV